MKTTNPPRGHAAGSCVTSNTRRNTANNTHYTNSCKQSFTGGGVYSRSHSLIKIKIKKMIVQVGSYAPDLAHWLLNAFGLRGV